MKFALVNGVMSLVTQQDPLSDAAGDAIGNFVLWGIKSFVTWFVNNGFPVCAELALVWAMVCFLVAITGHGKWLERGAKWMIGSVLFAVAGWSHALS